MADWFSENDPSQAGSPTPTATPAATLSLVAQETPGAKTSWFSENDPDKPGSQGNWFEQNDPHKAAPSPTPDTDRAIQEIDQPAAHPEILPSRPWTSQPVPGITAPLYQPKRITAGEDIATLDYQRTKMGLQPSPPHEASPFEAAGMNTIQGLVSGTTSVQGMIQMMPPVFVTETIANSPQIWQKVQEAENTPAGSQERWEAGMALVGALTTAGLISAGAGNEFVSNMRAAAEYKAASRMIAREGLSSKEIPPIDIQPSTGGTEDASGIGGTTQIPQREVRTPVGQEARVRQQGQAAQPGSQPLPASERPVAAAAPSPAPAAAPVIPEEDVKYTGQPPPEVPKPPVPSSEEPRLTAIKNAQVDKERSARGLPSAMQAARQSFGPLWDEAMSDVEAADRNRQPHPADVLVEELNTKPRAMTGKDDALLLHKQIELQNEYDKVAREQIAAHESNNPELVAEHDVRLAELSDKLQDVYNAGKAGGTETARGLVFRKQLAAEDFSLAKMMTDKRVGLGGRRLTPFEEAEVRRSHADISARQIALDAYETSPRAEAYRKALRKRAEEYRERTAKGDFEPRKKKPLTLDKEHLALQAEVEKAKQDWRNALEKDKLARRSWWEKAGDTLLKWRRASVISGVRSIAKLASAAIEGTIILPVREAVGTGLKHLPLISEVAKRAPREGAGFNVRAEALAFSETWKNLISDFTKNIKGEKPEFEQVFGRPRDQPKELQNYVGFLHGALKSPLARNEFTRSLAQRTEFAARHGVDITDPLVQMELGRQALEDSVFWRFQNRNLASQVYRMMLRQLETTKLPGAQGIGKAASMAIQAEVPIVTVPTNVLARTFEGVFGTIPGLARLGKAYAEGIETLTPAQADLIMRNLKTGSLGLALTLIGFFAPQIFGGFYRPGMKKTPGDPGFGEMKIGNVNIPPYLQDNPFLIMPQFGATMRQVADSRLRKSDTQTAGLFLGVWSAITGAAQQQPFVREAVELPRAFNPQQAGNILGDHARSYVIPMALQQIAQMTDPEKRYPKGFTEQLMFGIPGLRQQLPNYPARRRSRSPVFQ